MASVSGVRSSVPKAIRTAALAAQGTRGHVVDPPPRLRVPARRRRTASATRSRLELVEGGGGARAAGRRTAPSRPGDPEAGRRTAGRTPTCTASPAARWPAAAGPTAARRPSTRWSPRRRARACTRCSPRSPDVAAQVGLQVGDARPARRPAPRWLACQPRVDQRGHRLARDGGARRRTRGSSCGWRWRGSRPTCSAAHVRARRLEHPASAGSATRNDDQYGPVACVVARAALAVALEQVDDDLDGAGRPVVARSQRRGARGPCRSGPAGASGGRAWCRSSRCRWRRRPR